MSMDKDRLGQNLTDAVTDFMGENAPLPLDEAQLLALMKIFAEEVITEITDHLQATGTTAVVGGSSAGTHQTTIPEGNAS